MAKTFYSLEEAAARLGVTPDEVRNLVSQGRLQEFRDRDRLIFKVDQVELLAGGDDGDIPLAPDQSGSGIPIVLDEKSASGSGIALEEGPKERSGISIFDADELELADPSAVTQITQSHGGELTMEAVGSGSGLLDLTREGDDTSLGADLLQDVYGSEGSRAGSGIHHETAGTSGLFETTGAVSDVSPGIAVGGGAVMVAAEPFDGPGSGFAGGVALGVLLVAALSMVVVIFGIVGGSPEVADAVTGLPAYPWGFIGIGAAAVLIFGLIGWAIGRKG